MITALQKIKSLAVNASILQPAALSDALNRMGFVQADPIRAPARAQDLILRHRVANYRVGDLEAEYEKLGIEEDVLYAYGFLSRSNYELLHPRTNKRERLTKNERLVLELVAQREVLHPADLMPLLGSERTVNAWGGYSKVSTRLLEDLHYRGYLRIVRRKEGIKLYGIARTNQQLLDDWQRLRNLTLLIARILAPAQESSLRSVVNRLSYGAPSLPGRKGIVKELLTSGELNAMEIDGVRYLLPATLPVEVAPPAVRLLAPFDPIVWDRARFEHLWGWPYRFEAYVPASKRVYGYYALPILWNENVVGWANVSVPENKLAVQTGFINGKVKRDREFRLAMDEEILRFAEFLKGQSRDVLHDSNVSSA